MNKIAKNKQCRIPCLPFLSFLRILLALLKINGAANKSEFLVQPQASSLKEKNSSLLPGNSLEARLLHR